MSVFGEFQQMWHSRFPQGTLSSTWAEDVRANLETHKQRVIVLQEELEKEEVYVKYLETLLTEFESHQKKEQELLSLREQQDNTSNSPTENNMPPFSPSAPPRESPLNETAASKCVTELSECMRESVSSNHLVTSTTSINNSTSIDLGGGGTSTSNTSTSSSSIHSGVTKGENDLNAKKDDLSKDPSTFVTVIAVNGNKSANSRGSTEAGGLSGVGSKPKSIGPERIPPMLPAKPKLKPFAPQGSPKRSASLDSNLSSNEQLSPVDEPYYDLVAIEDEKVDKSEGSSTENVFSSSSTLPLGKQRNSIEPQSPEPTSNYVNIEYIIKHQLGHDSDGDDEDEDEPPLRKNTDNLSYASSSSLESSTPASRRKFWHVAAAESSASGESGERSTMYKSILLNIIDSERNYVEWLNVLLQYMKAIKATMQTSRPLVTDAEYKTIFYKIPDLHDLHSKFLDSLKRHAKKWDSRVGDSFKNMANNLELYGAFLGNYGNAVDTAHRCSVNSTTFADISRNITCKQLADQPVSLEELLHKPVARIQKNALVLHDLLKFTPKSNQGDWQGLSDALEITQKFLDQFNMIQTKSMFPSNDRAQRRLVKNSFIVEYVDNNRKLRHLFLFNDVIACAKYKASGKNELKYTFELKWFIPVQDIFILEESIANPHEVPSSNIVALKSQAANVRDQIRHEEKISEEKKIRLSRGSEKSRKRLLELESQLVLVSPNLRFRIKSRHPPQTKSVFEFFLSSEFERTQWIEAIQTLQQAGQPPTPTSSYSMLELQQWITACRTYLKTNMGSYLLRSGHDEMLLIGDLHVTVYDMHGLEYPADLYITIEVDFYGHYFRKARTKLISNSRNPIWNEQFVIDLEGCENLRFLVYRESGSNTSGNTATLFGKFTQQLSRQWLLNAPTAVDSGIVERRLRINGCDLRVGLRYTPNEVALRRVPSGKAGALFGEKIQTVCKRQKRDIPFIVSACIREVERRGMFEVGVYRVSSSASDLAQLKKSFETNSYEAEQLLKEVDIHSVTGILKLYLRELPEALFTDTMYPMLIEVFNQFNGNLTRRTEELNDCFKKLPKENQATITCILVHLIKVYHHENDNKMSLQNLATVFGPTLLRPGGRNDLKLPQRSGGVLASETVDVMAQASILLCYLQDMKNRDC